MLQILLRRKLALAAVIVLAAGAAVAIKLNSRSTPTGAATVQVLVDSQDSALANLAQDPAPLALRAAVFAQVMASQAVLQDIGKAAGVPASEITAQGPYSGSGQTLDVVTPSAARANQLLTEKTPYRITFVPQTGEPVITATVRGPSALAAARVASAVFAGAQSYLSTLRRQTHTPPAHQVSLRQLGAPQAGTVNSGSATTVSAAAAVGVLLLGVLLILSIEGQRRALERRSLQTLDETATSMGSR